MNSASIIAWRRIRGGLDGEREKYLYPVPDAAANPAILGRLRRVGSQPPCG